MTWGDVEVPGKQMGDSYGWAGATEHKRYGEDAGVCMEYGVRKKAAGLAVTCNLLLASLTDFTCEKLAEKVSHGNHITTTTLQLSYLQAICHAPKS